MCEPALQNSKKTAIPAHLWPFKMDENCEEMSERFVVQTLKPTPIQVDTQRSLNFTLNIFRSSAMPNSTVLPQPQTQPPHPANLESLRRLVIREILQPLSRGSLHRTVPAESCVDFDPQLVWLVNSGTATLELQGRGVLTLEAEDLLGSWFGSVGPISLVTDCSQSCELVGFAWAAIEQTLAADPRKLHLWCSFQAALSAEFFASFAELKVSSTPPTPRYRHYAPGETILLEGDDGDEVFVLTSGAASVQVRGSSVGEIHEDEVFGALSALIQGGTRSATVVATEPSDCMVFDRGEFRDLLRNNPRLMEKLFVDFARALHDANDSMLRASSTKWRHLF